MLYDESKLRELLPLQVRRGTPVVASTHNSRASVSFANANFLHYGVNCLRVRAQQESVQFRKAWQMMKCFNEVQGLPS